MHGGNVSISSKDATEADSRRGYELPNHQDPQRSRSNFSLHSPQYLKPLWHVEDNYDNLQAENSLLSLEDC